MQFYVRLMDRVSRVAWQKLKIGVLILVCQMELKMLSVTYSTLLPDGVYVSHDVFDSYCQVEFNTSSTAFLLHYFATCNTLPRQLRTMTKLYITKTKT